MVEDRAVITIPVSPKELDFLYAHGFVYGENDRDVGPVGSGMIRLVETEAPGG